MYLNDDALSKKWDDLADWEKANCPFYLEHIIDPPVMFDDWEDLCFTKLQELRKAEVALEESSQDPDSKPSLEAERKSAEEKLLHVFDPRKLQNLSAEECLEQAKALEPRADQVVTSFTKLKRKKEEATPKTPTPEKIPEQVEEPATEGLAESSPAPKKNTRKSKKNKDVDDVPSKENPTSTTGAVDVEVLDATADPTASQAEPKRTTQAEQTQETRNPKRLKKKLVEAKDFSNGEFRIDLQFTMEDKWVAVKSSLHNIILALKSKKQGAWSRGTVPALEAVTGICKRLKEAGRRPRKFLINKKKVEQGVDLILFDIPTGRSIDPEADIPRWNRFPAAENYPRMLLNFASKVLDDNSFVIIFHAGSLQSSQQIADSLDALDREWKLFLSFDICNDAPTYVPKMKFSVSYHFLHLHDFVMLSTPHYV
ncbi:hypothetical protein R1sor_010530 [Riccia sorocarpa]|uniref:Uncharacterized protein n=1 Tax=Riccia sorocarpa TaxID=122646 RepID=A0ABD3I4E4_9MARC